MEHLAARGRRRAGSVLRLSCPPEFPHRARVDRVVAEASEGAAVPAVVGEEDGETMRRSARPGRRWMVSLLISASAVIQCSSGMNWNVRSHPGPPGNGCWGSTEQSVRLDADGLVRLSLSEVEGRWCQAEVVAARSASYGRHRFQVISRLDRLHPSVVLGMFLYADDRHEIDIEMSRALSGPGELGIYAVQPATGARVHRFPVNLSGDHTTHQIDWSPGKIRFSSWHGHCPEGPCAGWIEQWEYDGPGIPAESDLLSVRMNLWLKGDLQPDAPQEVVLRYEYESPVE